MGANMSTSDGRACRLLKIVHPGGVAEVYDRPIYAATVLDRNPRHCITRPDVFRRPWIVVRPDSLLMPGMKFYLVPKRTIRRLVKQNGISVEATNSMDPESTECSISRESAEGPDSPKSTADSALKISSDADPVLETSYGKRKKSSGSPTLAQFLAEASVPIYRGIDCSESYAAKLGFNIMAPSTTDSERPTSSYRANAPCTLLYCQLAAHPRACIPSMANRDVRVSNARPAGGGRPTCSRRVTFASPCVQQIYYIEPYCSPDQTSASELLNYDI